MPLLNHFVPLLALTHPWSGFHSTWANTITARLISYSGDKIDARAAPGWLERQ